MLIEEYKNYVYVLAQLRWFQRQERLEHLQLPNVNTYIVQLQAVLDADMAQDVFEQDAISVIIERQIIRKTPATIRAEAEAAINQLKSELVQHQQHNQDIIEGLNQHEARINARFNNYAQLLTRIDADPRSQSDVFIQLRRDIKFFLKSERLSAEIATRNNPDGYINPKLFIYKRSLKWRVDLEDLTDPYHRLKKRSALIALLIITGVVLATIAFLISIPLTHGASFVALMGFLSINTAGLATSVAAIPFIGSLLTPLVTSTVLPLIGAAILSAFATLGAWAMKGYAAVEWKQAKYSVQERLGMDTHSDIEAASQSLEQDNGVRLSFNTDIVVPDDDVPAEQHNGLFNLFNSARLWLTRAPVASQVIPPYSEADPKVHLDIKDDAAASPSNSESTPTRPSSSA